MTLPKITFWPIQKGSHRIQLIRPFWGLHNLLRPFPANFWTLSLDQTFHQFHDLYTELDLHRIMSGFHGAFATGVASQQGTLTLPDTWFHPPFWDLLMLQLLRPNSSNLPCLYSTFHLEFLLVLSRFCLEPSSVHYLICKGYSVCKSSCIDSWLSLI